MLLTYSLVNLKGYGINYQLFKSFRKNCTLMEKNHQKQKFMKRIYKKIIFIILVFALFSVKVGVIKYSLTFIENNPEKYLPKQK